MATELATFDHGDGKSGVVINSRDISGDYGPLRVWLPGSAGFPAEVSFPDDFWRCDREGLVAMREVLDLAIRTMDDSASGAV